MKKQNIFLRVIIILFSLLFCVVAIGTTSVGMLFGGARNVITPDFWMDVLGEQVQIGTVLNTVGNHEKYAEDATLAQVTLEKLDPVTVGKYNLSEENLNQIYETPEFKTFVSEKMGSAMEAATEGGTFTMTSTEIVDVLRESEARFTEITGIEMTEETYAEIETAVVDAGFESYEVNFSEAGLSDITELISRVFSVRLDLILYGVTVLIFMLIFFMNWRTKHRVFLYAGGVVLLCGLFFTNLKKMMGEVTVFMPEDIGNVLNKASDFVSGIVANVAENAVKIGAGLLVIYMVLAVLVFVKRVVFHR